MEIVAINDINRDIENIAYTINYDSTYGWLQHKFKAHNGAIKNKKQTVQVFHESSLAYINFEALNIDYIIDSSGTCPDFQILHKLPVQNILITHPNKDADINVIMGVNHEHIKQQHKIISTSSCNATALLPVLQLIDDTFTIECGEITTIHPLLNHQKVLDTHCIESKIREVQCNFEFGRSALDNIIPTQTTTIEACSYVLPHINKSILSSSSLRVPIATVGAIDVTILIQKSSSKEELVALFKQYQKNQKYKIIHNNFAHLVSSDFKKLPYNLSIDHRFTKVKIGKMIKLLLWYDNEWGYAQKVVDTIHYLYGGKLCR